MAGTFHRAQIVNYDLQDACQCLCYKMAGLLDRSSQGRQANRDQASIKSLGKIC